MIDIFWHRFLREFSATTITEQIAGKTIQSFGNYDANGDDFIVVRFTDGTALYIRYDWIYEWGMVEGGEK